MMHIDALQEMTDECLGKACALSDHAICNMMSSTSMSQAAEPHPWCLWPAWVTVTQDKH
jgi:hypothetical protein